MAEEVSEPADQDARGFTDEQTEEFAEIITDVYNEETTFREIVGIDEDTIAFAQQQAYKLYANERYEKAEPLARGLVALDNTRFYPNMLLGDILFQLGPGISEHGMEVVTDAEEGTTRTMTLYEEALETFERANEIDSEDEFVRTRLAELYLKLDEEEKAEEFLEDLAENGETEQTQNWANTLLGIARKHSD